MTGFLALAGFAGVWWVLRGVIGRRAERRFEAAYRRGHDGIILGAEPLLLSGRRPGAVLLLHGYNDSPQSVASMAAALHARGWTVRVPLLPGHGRSLPAFARSGADAWLNEARIELAALRATHTELAVGGLSMGGAIAFVLAAEHPAVRAVVAFAPYLHAPLPHRVVDALAAVAVLGARYVRSGGKRSIHDPLAGARMIAYRRSTPRLLAQVDHIVRIAFESLKRVKQPVLLVQSREDNRIPPHAAEEAYAQLGSEDKTLHWVKGRGHVLTMDYGHSALEALAADWLESRLR